MVTHDANASSGQTGKLFSPPLLGFIAGVLGVAACACGFYSLVAETQPTSIISALLAIAGATCGIIHIVGFRRQLEKHDRAWTLVSSRSQEREITAASWALVAACIGACLSLLAISWLFL